MEIFKNNKELITLIATILLAMAGFIVKYANDLAIARRRDQLDRVNAQLRLLYGPLFALTQASVTVWKAFRAQYRPGMPYFSSSRPPNESEIEAWRIWAKKAFMPLNRRMMETIITNADLLDGEMPSEFLDLVAHVSSYETLLERWAANDFKDHIPEIAFPSAIGSVVKTEYKKLRGVQQSLLAAAAQFDELNASDYQTFS